MKDDKALIPKDETLPAKGPITIDQIYALAPILEDDKEFEASLVIMMVALLENTQWESTLSKKRRFNQLPVLSHVPMVCRTTQCPYHDVCPIMAAIGDDNKAKEKLYGGRCRIDMIELVQIFVELVKDLDIQPSHAIDVMHVTSLVRLYILRRRCDWELQGGMREDIIAVVNPRTDTPYYKPDNNSILDIIDKIEKQIHSLVSQLLGSRKDRALLDAKTGRGTSLEQILAGTGLGKGLVDKHKDVIDVSGPELDDMPPE